MRALLLWIVMIWQFSRAIWVQVTRCSAWRVPSSLGASCQRIPPLLSPCTSRHRPTFRLFATVQSIDTDYHEFTKLAEEIRRHDDLYYGGGKTELTDDEYDALVVQEAEYCKENPEFLDRYQQESGLGIQATRFGGRVGAIQVQQVETKRQTHLSPMLSLSNVHSTPQLLQWLERIRKLLLKKQDNDDVTTLDSVTVVTEPKLDGLSLSLRYKPNNTKRNEYTLQWAATRGDGSEGQDVTLAVRALQDIPATISSSDMLPTSTLEVRGEVILPTTAFGALQTNFSNARNAASGILLRKTKELNQEDRELQSQLKFFAYDVVSDDKETDLVENGVQLRSLLSERGFTVPEPVQVSTLPLSNETEWMEKDISSLLDYYNDLERQRQNETSKLNWGDYEMDGVVHKVSSLYLRQVLGTTNRSPRWAVAHKFPAETALSSLLDVQVQVGRTGALTPVAILEPVDIAGVVVQRATLHNFGFLQQLMGNVSSIPKGTKVLVRRAGDVIPQVVQRVAGIESEEHDVKNDTEMISLETPKTCPACGSPAIVVESLNNSTDNSTQGQVVRCGGPALNCPPRAVGALAHAFSRDALDVTGLSEARIQQLLDADLIKVPADVFVLASTGDESDALLANITELPGWGDKSAQNLARVVKRIVTKGVSLPRFIYSLGIRHAGQHTSKLIASAYGSADTFLLAIEEALKSNNETVFAVLAGSNGTEGIKGIGPAQVASLLTFALEKEAVHAARKLANAIPIHDEVIAVGLVEELSPSEERPWEGYRVVFTGSLPNGLSRKEAQELARRLGAKSTPASLSKSTDLVVAGEKGGKKLAQAVDLGVRVMNGDEFADLVETHIPSEV